jgi:hypothetical protein
MTTINNAQNWNQRLPLCQTLSNARVLLVRTMIMDMQLKERKLIMKMTTKREVFPSSIQVERSVILTPASSIPYKSIFTVMKNRAKLLV